MICAIQKRHSQLVINDTNADRASMAPASRSMTTN